MAKRFTDSFKYKKKFFRELPGSYKLLWDFLYHDCDNCGIWIVDFEMAQKYVGKDMVIDQETAMNIFNKDEIRIIEIDGGEKWFLPGFIEFQYGGLSEKNRAHIPVISALKKYDLLNPDYSLKEKNKGDTAPLQGAKDKAQDKEMDKDKEFYSPNPENEVEGFNYDPAAVIPEMVKVFLSENPNYPTDKTIDYSALLIVAKNILKEQKIPGTEYNENKKIIVTRWGELVKFIRNHKHFSLYSLTQIQKNYQSIIQSIHNGTSADQSTIAKTKTGTSEARVTALKNWGVKST